MKKWLIQIKREFWEYQMLFVNIPLVIASLIIIAGIYIVTMQASLDSRVGMGLFGNTYQLDTYKNTGKNSDSSRGNTVTGKASSDEQLEYVIDFNKQELIPAKAAGISRTGSSSRKINAELYGFHSFIILITGIVLMFYLISCLHGDRKDRSILFWKSMPVSETRNVAAKLIVALLAVPLLTTVISWGIQLCFLGLSSIFVYRVGFHPGEIVWAQLNLPHVFSQEIILILWNMAWWAPLAAWLLFASALGKRSPFLIATVPVVVVIIMEKLLFGTWSIGNFFLTHPKAVGYQLSNLVGDEYTGPAGGTVNLFLDNPTMFAGLVIAGLLFTATVWLRNHRFEI